MCIRDRTDILVIGAGVAGFSFAIRMAEKRPDLKITVLTKTNEKESNTSYAQGGVAAVSYTHLDVYKRQSQSDQAAVHGRVQVLVVHVAHIAHFLESCTLIERQIQARRLDPFQAFTPTDADPG